jgi:hypothetical protein
VTSDPSPTDEHGRIVPFRRPGAAGPVWRWPVRELPKGDPVDDLAKFEREEGEDDYRHRMTMNALALVATVILVGAGVWLATTISEMVKTQDCYLSGRRNCAPIEVGPIKQG